MGLLPLVDQPAAERSLLKIEIDQLYHRTMIFEIYWINMEVAITFSSFVFKNVTVKFIPQSLK